MNKTKFVLLFCIFLFVDLQSQNSKIVLIGDTQRTLWFELFREDNEYIRQLIFPKISFEKPSSLIILGDLTNWGASESEWKYFDSITKSIKNSNISIFPLFGNHDYFGNNQTALNNMRKRFEFFEKNTWYSKEINSIGFVFLNSNLQELTNDERISQKYFLDSVLKSFESNINIRNTICCWHHPIYTNSKVVDDEQDTKEEFLPIISQYLKVKMIASGHCHSYEHFKTDGIHFLVSGGAGGPRQKVWIGNNARHKDLFDGDELRNFHYCLLEEINFKLKVTIIAYNDETKTWSQIDSWKVD
jgi:predicted phosphodiesterase